MAYWAVLFNIISIKIILGHGNQINMQDKLDIKDSLMYAKNEKVAKNILLFIGDGMSPSTITASRIYGKGPKGYLAFEKFPNVAVLKTYSNNKLVPDSASSATALFTGQKVNHRTVSVNTEIYMEDCKKSANDSYKLDTIALWAQRASKSTGFVTTTRVTHATPAALYAHASNRNYECDAKVPPECPLKDIGRQLIEDQPGKSFNVIMGGGRQCLESNVVKDNNINPWECYRSDGRNLIETWKLSKLNKSAIVRNNFELNSINFDETDYLLGIFANSHLSMNYNRDKGPSGSPSLTNMTTAALKILKKNNQGFFLMVEGGLIDYAHHRGHAKQALDETVEFSNAIEASIEYLRNQEILDDTLVIVTSDHSHALQINGYPNIDDDILGIAGRSKRDGTPYTILTYSSGGWNNNAYFSENRSDPTENGPTNSFNYSQQALIVTDEAFHEGTDVLVYAKGPMSHLFTSTHEQSYVAHVMAYAMQIGPYAKESLATYQSASMILTIISMLVIMIINIVYT